MSLGGLVGVVLVKAFAVALVVACVCIVGVGPVDASQQASGTKAFLKDCTLRMSGNSGYFSASDHGSECGDYFIRGVSMVSASGRYHSQWFDHNGSTTYESLEVFGELQDFLYGTADVYIPYRSRCDRYRLYASNAVRLVDSRPCSGPPTTHGREVGGYRVSTAPGMRSVRADFEVTGGTCSDQESVMGHGVRLAWGFHSHLALLDYYCEDGNLHYLADVMADGEQSVVQKPTAIGDRMRVSVVISAGTATATVRNVTKGWIHRKSGAAGDLDLARIGTFRPDEDPVPRFDPVAFTNVTIGGVPLDDWDLERVRLTYLEGGLTESCCVVQVLPSDITNGTRFTNTWIHA